MDNKKMRRALEKENISFINKLVYDYNSKNIPKDRKSKCSVSKLVKRTNEFKYFFWIMFNIIWFWEYCG